MNDKEKRMNKMLEWFTLHNLKPRPQQIKVLKQIAENWDKKFFIVSAPTGVGKQFIALAASHLAGKSIVLTHTKQLQDQYLHGPGSVVDLRGRPNYKCGINPLMTAVEAPCNSFKNILKKCYQKRICPYLKQRDLALSSPLFTTNYAYFLYSRLCGPLQDDIYEQRELLVCDEGHILENQLVSFTEVVLNPEILKEEYGIYDFNWIITDGHNKKENEKIVQSIYERVIEEKRDYENEIKSIFESYSINENSELSKIENLSSKVLKRIKECQKQFDKLDKFQKRLDIYHSNPKGWFLHGDAKKGVLTLTPIYAKGIFSRFCETAARKHLFLSATIGNFDVFVDELGLNRDECCFIDIEESFNPESAPIILTSVGKFNYNEIDATLPYAVKAIDKILENHKTDKGIIHASNYKITQYIAKKSTQKHRLLHKYINSRYSVNNEDLLKEHIKTKRPTVLLSPSMNTGISLDDDLARFQIIVKLPFASLGDIRQKEKMNLDRDWYINNMWKEIMQAAGRSVRSEDDYCVTYILDESFNYFYHKYKKKLPKWFVNRILT